MFFKKKEKEELKKNTDNSATTGVFQATQAIADAFEKAGFNYKISKIDDASLVDAMFSGETTGIRILFISKDDSNNVAVRAFNIVKFVPEDRRSDLLKAINRYNKEYRYAAFFLDDDGSVNMRFDMPPSEKNVGAIAIEISALFVNIIDDCYPDLMKTIWG